MTDNQYVDFVRSRITELRIKKDVSEHRMSLDLDKSGSYIRGITSGASMPSVKELFNIMLYFNMTPAEFFAPLEPANSPYAVLCNRLRSLRESDLEKVQTLIDWISAEQGDQE